MDWMRLSPEKDGVREASGGRGREVVTLERISSPETGQRKGPPDRNA